MSTGVLTQLLRTFNAARRQDQAHSYLDPEQENRYTQSLLFPETTSARSPGPLIRSYSNPDSEHSFRGPRPEPLLKAIDLEYPRDVRIIIAQEDNNPSGALLLFDSRSQPPGDAANPRFSKTSRNDVPSASTGVRHHARAPSVSIIPEDTDRHRLNDNLTTAGSFAQRATRQRKTSISSLPEDSSQLRPREQDEVLNTAFGVMFENAASSLKVTSNKIHIVPVQKATPDLSIYGSSLSNDQSTGYLGHRPSGTFSRRPSSLSQSFVPGEDRLQSPRLGLRRELAPQSRRTILITRTFSITWSEDKNEITHEPGSDNDSAQSVPSRSAPPNASTKEEVRDDASDVGSRKVFRSPMYAITIVLQLPIANKDSPPGSRQGTNSSTQKASQVFGSSWGSEGRSTWGLSESMFGLDANLPQTFTSDVDDRVGLIGQHWDIINRTIATLQVTVERRLLTLLRPHPRIYRGFKLPFKILDKDEVVRNAVNGSGTRVARGITLPRVSTGQGRWPLWQEEARWISQSTAQTGETSFLHVLLSAFLGTHTEWIEALASQDDRERHADHRRDQPGNDQDVLKRTLIVSPDKLVARRLVFLLSSFLPGPPVIPGDVLSPRATGTPPFGRTHSQSPPVIVSMSRQQSLRRQINRRSRLVGQQSIPDQPNKVDASLNIEAKQDHSDVDFVRKSYQGSQTRRGSDARSILGAQSAIDETESLTRKSSATTGVTMIDPAPLSPTVFQRVAPSTDQLPKRRPESGSSQASLTLNNALQRSVSDRTSVDGSRWGSFKSIWSMASRRESFTENSDILQTPDEGLGIAGFRRKPPSKPTLERMVDEAELYRRDSTEQFCLELGSKPEEPANPEIVPQSPMDDYPETPRSLFADIGPKATINEIDGVIDVEIPFEQWGSPVQSPPIAAFTSDSSWEDGSMQSSLIMPNQRDIEPHSFNVGGWLDTLHPDFILQAVKPYEKMLTEVRAAMSAERTPWSSLSHLKDPTGEAWVTVCTTIIADTRAMSVKRLNLLRLVKLHRPDHDSNPCALNIPSQRDLDDHTSSKIQTLDERFEEEPLTKLDSQLSQAVERLISRASSWSRARNSAASSRSNSYRGRGKARRRPTLEDMGIDIREHTADNDVPPPRDTYRDQAPDAVDSGLETSSELPRDIILGTLQELIRNIAIERKRPVEIETSAAGPKPISALKEGVIRWFDELDSRESRLSTNDRPESSQPIDTPRIIARDHSDPAQAVSDAVRSLEV